MTYGEAVSIQKGTMRMQNGIWVSDPLPAHVRLSEKEAFEYYGRKFDEYWASLPPSKPTQGKRRKKEPLPPSVIERLLGIKELAQKGARSHGDDYERYKIAHHNQTGRQARERHFKFRQKG